MKKLLPLFILVIVLAGVFLFLKLNKPSGTPATVWEQDTEIQVEAARLFEDFVQDEAGANEKYLNKIVEVSGQVSTVSVGGGRTAVVLGTNDANFGIRCRLEERPGQASSKYQVGQSVTFKCVCSGYVSDVEMVQCMERQ